jgi:hypothetical protein
MMNSIKDIKSSAHFLAYGNDEFDQRYKKFGALLGLRQ